jgi:periplasmic copper chaperone A
MNTKLISVLFATFATLTLASHAFADVSVDGAWVRGTVAKQTATGAFMTLKTAKATQLISAASPVAEVVEVHEMVMDGNMMKMRAMPKLDIPANTPVELKPGSYHIMLMGLKKPLVDGEKVPLTLNFENAAKQKEKLEIQAEVRPMTQMPMQHNH